MQTIDHDYDQWFTQNPHEGMELIRRLTDQLKDRDCCFADQAIPCFFKPYFLNRDTTDQLRNLVHLIAEMIERLAHAYLKYKEIRPHFSIPKHFENWIRIDPGYKRCVLIARPDAFLTPQGFRFVEFNCDSPAGPGYADIEERILRESPVMRSLHGRYRFLTNQRMKGLMHALLSCYREYGGGRPHPHIAIVDWKDVRTRNEFMIIKQYLETQGYPCRLADPRELRFKKGRLYLKDFRIDLIYRRVIFNELWNCRDEVRDLLKAYRLGKVCIVNPLRSRLVANKAMLSFMTDPQFDFLFTPEQLQIRDRNIQWTRTISHMSRKRSKEVVKLKQYMIRHQKELVLKPADRYGGHGVMIGKETPAQNWQKAIRHAMSGSDRWVIQKYVRILQMTVPIIHHRRLALVRKKMNINPFIFNGKYSGAMARLSRRSVINVSAGGGLIPAVSYVER